MEEPSTASTADEIDGLEAGGVSGPEGSAAAVLDDAAFGAATEVTPKFISPADPAARWTGADGGQTSTLPSMAIRLGPGPYDELPP